VDSNQARHSRWRVPPPQQFQGATTLIRLCRGAFCAHIAGKRHTRAQSEQASATAKSRGASLRSMSAALRITAAKAPSRRHSATENKFIYVFICCMGRINVAPPVGGENEGPLRIHAVISKNAELHWRFDKRIRRFAERGLHGLIR
jgi:hypothetical protein